jgi:3D-(3,5/4)-trihydroxycyclohexane-1,2-dione acylhydrolase (decyclizing)
MGVTGNLAANSAAEAADLVLAVGTRLTDFTTASKSLFQNPDVRFIALNISRFHAYKADSIKAVGDAKAGLTALTEALKKKGYSSGWLNEAEEWKAAWDKQMEVFADYAYDDDFEPIVKAGTKGSIEEFMELTGGIITQTSALCLIRKMLPENAIVVGASGSLPGDLQRMWATDVRNSYHMEYGYSCMGYEIAASLGAKLAAPDQEVYAMTGDGSYLMLHADLVTSLQERKKINVLLFDNCGFGCINNLQMSNGIGSLATEFRYRGKDGNLSGGLMPIDYAKAAEGYGAKTYTATTLGELESALEDSMKQTVSTLIDIKVLPKTMTEGYKSWWHVGIASTSDKKSVKTAFKNKEASLKKARLY